MLSSNVLQKYTGRKEKENMNHIIHVRLSNKSANKSQISYQHNIFLNAYFFSINIDAYIIDCHRIFLPHISFSYL